MIPLSPLSANEREMAEAAWDKAARDRAGFGLEAAGWGRLVLEAYDGLLARLEAAENVARAAEGMATAEEVGAPWQISACRNELSSALAAWVDPECGPEPKEDTNE